MIQCSRYVYFEEWDGKFWLTDEALNLICSKKHIIVSEVGANEWCNFFFCQLINIFSGNSEYNYSLPITTDYEMGIETIWKTNKNAVIDWLFESKKEKWFIKCGATFDFLIDNLIEKGKV